LFTINIFYAESKSGGTMIILGFNGTFGSPAQDPAAVIMQNGNVLFAAEEERYSRIKFSPGKLPLLAIKNALDYLHLKMEDIDVAAFHGATWHPSIDEKLSLFFQNNFGVLPRIVRYHHHDAHGAAAYFASGFEESLVFTIDGAGDGVSSRIYSAKGATLTLLDEYRRPQSLGIFYTAITQLCGFNKDRDEYKLMGLSAYGNKDRFDLSDFLNFKNGRYVINEAYLTGYQEGKPSSDNQQMVYSEKLPHLLKIARRIDNALVQEYKDLAAAAQHHLEITVKNMVKFWIEKTGIRNICLSGGVSLNCMMNSKLMQMPEVSNIYVPPVAADMGVALGCAYLASIENQVTPQKLTHAFLGNEFSNEQIEETLLKCHLTFRTEKDIIKKATDYLVENKVIGWFQGRMEYGPRALGNRSILALPCKPAVKDLVNKKIKFRESFRPFGATVLEEDFDIYFEGKIKESPFMTMIYTVKEHMRNVIPAVVHLDHSCRVQTVNQNQNALLYQLLKSIKQKTGHGVLLNTSYNLNHEPIVNSPRDAIAGYFASGLDALIIGNYVLEK
jgi:carbamoyltransferase